MSETAIAKAEDGEDLLSFLDDEEKIATYFEYLENFFIYNLAKNVKNTSLVAKKIIAEYEPFIQDKVSFTGGKPDPKSKLRYKSASMSDKKIAVKESDWTQLVEFFGKIAEAGPPEGCFIPDNLKLFSEIFGLPDHMKWPILFAEVMRLESANFGTLIRDILTGNTNRLGTLISKIIPDLTREQRAEIAESTNMSSDLVRKGLLTPCVDIMEDSTEAEYSEVPPYIRELLFDPALTKEKIVMEIIGEPTVEPEFTIENFPQYKRDIEEILDIVRGAIEAGEKGINILLFGPAGVGKTALAAAIAGALELELYTIGEQNPDEDDDREYKNGSATSKFRIGKLQQAHALLKDTKKAALFFDEIEDVLNKGTDSSKKPDVFSKILFNRLLETNPIVTIWAGNDLDKFHESVLQRFSYSLSVGQAPTMMRREIWVTQAKKNDVKIDDADLLQLARDFVAPPRIIGKALNNARLSSRTDIKTITGFIEKASLITYGSEDELRHNSGLSRYFSRDLLPPELVAEVDAWIKSGGKDKPASIFINAIRGAGVNAFAEEIAERLIMHPLSINAHDLSADSMQISAVDKIKRVFSAAARGNALLSIQNIEAFNENPDNPQGKWRNDLISQFVRSASEHGLPFVVSSMKPDVVLPPTLKPIFTINGTMGALSSEQVATATNIYFGIELPKEIDGKAQLVPADFSMARKISTKLPQQPTQEQIMEMVMTQARARQESGGAKIGF